MQATLSHDAARWTEALLGLPEDLRDVYFGAGYHELQHDAHLQPELGVVSQAGLPLLLVPGLREPIDAELCDLQTCNGYGGPLAAPGVEGARLLQAWDAWRAAASASGCVAAFFRLHPLLDNRRFLPPDAEIRTDRDTIYLDLEHGVDAALRAADSRFRNMASKAQRVGTVVGWNEPHAWSAFEQLYGQAMERLKAPASLRFSPEYFSRLRALPEAEIGFVEDERGLCAANVFLWGPRFGHYHVSARRADADNHVVSAIFAAAMQRAVARNVRGIHLGGGATTAADDRLLRFKLSLSPRRLRFEVARVIADPQRFAALESAWQARAGRPPRWLLGYREPLPQG